MTKMRLYSSTDSKWALVFLLPSLVGFMLFMVFPVLASLALSFTDWDLLSPIKWASINNYRELFKDVIFIKVFLNTVYYTAVTVPILVVMPLLLAMALNQKIRGIRFFRAAFFLPVISSMVAMSMVWQWLYNTEFGIINYLLSLIGIQGPSWLSTSNWAMPAIMITSIWKGLGFNMLIYLAGLQSIDKTYYEAADLDGANWFARTTKITVPLLSTTTYFIVVTTLVNSLQVFDQVVVMTGGGPSRSSSVLVHYLYQSAFKYFKMGYACALGYVLCLFIFLLTLTQFRQTKTWTLY